MADGIAAGDKIKVSGRMQLSEYTKKDGTKVKKWAVMADEIDTGKPPSVPQERPPIGDIPF
jgi:single-stranded DNA-binding protein